MCNWWSRVIGNFGGTALNIHLLWTRWMGSVEAVSWATVVEIFLNHFSTTCAFHLSDFRLLTQLIGNVALYSSTRSSCPFSFRMHEEACTCSLISLSHTRKSENTLGFLEPYVEWVAMLSTARAREILPREALLPSMALRNVSVWCTELRH